MVPYSPAPYRRPPLSPTLGQQFDSMFGWHPAVGDVVRLGFHGLTAYLGFYVGAKEKGFISAFGWFLGFGQAIGAACDVASLIKRVQGTHPPETTESVAP